MSLLAFDMDTATPSSRTRTVHPTVVETVTVTPLPSESRTHLLKPEGEWSWSELRDYVVAQIEARFGAFPRDSRKEHAIFTRFIKDHGSHAPAIARHAFDVCDGYWAGAPISINRFCKGSDPYFAAPIVARLLDVGTVTV